ncbi:heterokaryon incompatibility protein-domain-containing protein [Cladorrhinum sp. PSN332]|nr:heterokaryon incompatibility protein-domain-containing protein [Cladorrhinum sp. PSN332]
MTGQRSNKLGPTCPDLYKRKGLSLKRHEIRVLVMEPGDRESKPRCRLEKRLLQTRHPEPEDYECGRPGTPRGDPDYTALSYVWGSVDDPQAITCNGADFFVTRNLFAALVDVRSASEPQTLWIDAICINQNDDGEKSHQIARMGEIYSRATCTMVWLGRPSYLSGKGFKAWTSIANTMRAKHKASGDATPETMIGMLRRRLGGGGLMATVWNHSIIIPLFRREYFSRMWIVQEIALSRRLVLVCGNDRVTISDFILGSVGTLASDTGRHHLSTIVNILICRSLLPWAPQEGFEDAAYILPKLAKQRGDADVDKNLLTLLNLFRGNNATDPVDKIFGLAGLSREINADKTWDVDQLYPICSGMDKTDPARVERTFVSVARRILERQRSLQILGSVCHRGNIDASPWNLPSWVPDWTDRRSVPHPFTTIAEPSDGLEVATLFPEAPDRLVLSGSLMRNGDMIDRIDAVGKLCDSESWRRRNYFLMRNGLTLSESHRLDTVNHWCAQFLPGLPAPSDEFVAATTCGPAEGDLGSSIRVMLEKHKIRGFTALPLPHQLCLVYLLGRTMYLALHPSLGQLYFVTLNWTAFSLTLFGISYLFWKFWPMLGEPEELAKIELRRMARTTSGLLLLVPATTQPGDVIAICRGGVAPLVLRPVDADCGVDRISDFELVGECYVDGMMETSKWVFKRSGTMRLV